MPVPVVLLTFVLGALGLLVPGAATGGTDASGPVAVRSRPAPAHGVWPMGPPHLVLDGFRPPSSPWGPGHRGVDLLGSPGATVRTALAGTVVFAGPLAGRGVVVVDHGGVRTTYEPVEASVQVGQRVDRGEVLGRLQLARSHCFPRACLHWGLLRGDTYLDPLVLVGGGPIRLLPLDGSVGDHRASAAAPGLRVLARPAAFVGPVVVLTPAGAPVGTPRAAARR